MARSLLQSLCMRNTAPPESLDAAGFFAEHFTSLPPATCGQTLCLHGMLSVAPDLARGGDFTLLQMAMSSPIDPASVTRPPLDLALVIDHSGSMSGDSKEQFAKLGADHVIDQLGPNDTLTLIQFDDDVERLYGPGPVSDKAALHALVAGIAPDAGTNIYDALHDSYEAVLSVGDETQLRRVIFLTDGLPTVGITDLAAIEAMSSGYADRYAGLTTIGLGSDVDSGLLRRLAQRAGGNFYFVESGDALTDVFDTELAFFVAPIAYDIDLAFEEVPYFDLTDVFGSDLWTATTTGGAVHVPSAFLVSRTSSAPDPGGGRRGGGAALIAQLGAPRTAPTVTGDYVVGRLHLGYRRPGESARQTEDINVTWHGVPGQAPPGGYASDASIAKNTLVLDFFVAFRDATAIAQTDHAGARAALLAFEPRIEAALAGQTDADLLDDLAILKQYIAVLSK
jgi:Ca-activated chloride channel homolog